MANKKTSSEDNKSNLHEKSGPSKKGLWIFVILFAAIGGYILWRSFAAPAPPTIYLTPVTNTIAPGASFSIQVRENSGTTNVNAVQANFSYPTSLLTFVNIDTTGTAFTTSAPSSGGSGQVSIAAGVIGGVTGDQLIATVNFTSNSTSGSAALAFTSGTALVSSSTNQDILGSLAATAGGTYTVDATPPSVSITSPTNGSTLSGGSTVNINVSASDAASSVTKVEIFIDGSLVATDTSSPYTYAWNTTGVSLGAHVIQAKAYDSFNNVTTPTTANVTLADQTAPTVLITAPANNITLSGNVTVSATATDNVAVASVEFDISKGASGGVIAIDNTAPYTATWDSHSVTGGTGYTLSATATDTAGNTKTATITVNIDNTAPSAPTNFRSTGNSLTSISLAWNASTDNIGVAGYRISRNGTTITTTAGTAVSFNDTSLTSSTSYTYTIVALDGVGNASAAATLSASTQAGKIGDIDNNGSVDIIDLSKMLARWGTNDAAADINKDGTVNIVDLSLLLSHYGL